MLRAGCAQKKHDHGHRLDKVFAAYLINHRTQCAKTGEAYKLDFVHLSRIADGFCQAVEQGARYFHHIALLARPAVNPFAP
jgi:hypothetical protein